MGMLLWNRAVIFHHFTLTQYCKLSCESEMPRHDTKENHPGSDPKRHCPISKYRDSDRHSTDTRVTLCNIRGIRAGGNVLQCLKNGQPKGETRNNYKL